MSKIAAVILASGGSARMGANKLLLPLGGSTVFDQMLSRFPYHLFSRTVTVVADGAVAQVCESHPVTVVQNTTPEAGKSATIRLGVEACRDMGGILFLVADQPLLQPETISRILHGWDGETFRVPTVSGVQGNPVLFPNWSFGELMALTGDTGGKAVLAAHPKKVHTIVCDYPQEFLDIDTDDAYQKVAALWQE